MAENYDKLDKWFKEKQLTNPGLTAPLTVLGQIGKNNVQGVIPAFSQTMDQWSQVENINRQNALPQNQVVIDQSNPANLANPLLNVVNRQFANNAPVNTGVPQNDLIANYLKNSNTNVNPLANPSLAVAQPKTMPTTQGIGAISPAMANTVQNPNAFSAFFGRSALPQTSNVAQNTSTTFNPVVDNTVLNQRTNLNGQLNSLLDNYNSLAPTKDQGLAEFIVNRGLRSGIRNQINTLSPLISNANSLAESNINNQNTNNLTNIRDLRGNEIANRRLDNDILNTDSLIQNRNTATGLQALGIEDQLANSQMSRDMKNMELQSTAPLRTLQSNVNNTLLNGINLTPQELKSAETSQEGKVRIDQLKRSGMTEDQARTAFYDETKSLLSQRTLANQARALAIASNPSLAFSDTAKDGKGEFEAEVNGVKIKEATIQKFLESVKAVEDNAKQREKEKKREKDNTSIFGFGQKLTG